MTTTLNPRDSISRAARFKLLLLAVAVFLYVTFELYPVGLISTISHDLHVPEGYIGLLLSGYAIVAGIVTIPSVRIVHTLSHKAALLISLIVLIIAQLMTSVAHSYDIMALSRITGALTHGMLWSLVTPVAAALVPRKKTGTATAIVLSGATTALIFGGPATTTLGTTIGWHLTSLILAILTIATAIGIYFVLPSDTKDKLNTAEFPVASDKSVSWKKIIIVCILTILFVLSHFLSFTYFAVIVSAVTNIHSAVTFYMALFGITGAIATLLSGKYNDRFPVATTIVSIIVYFIGITLITISFHFPKTVLAEAVLGIAIVAWGAGCAAVAPCYQLGVMRSSGHQKEFCSSIYITSYQIGIASGSALGAVALETSAYYIPLTSFFIAVIAVVLTLYCRKVFAFSN